MGLFSGKKKPEAPKSNYLVELIELFKSGHIDEIHFMEMVLSCDGYVLGKEKNANDGVLTDPLIISNEKNGNSIAIFSDLNAAKKIMQIHNDYRCACGLGIGKLLFSLDDGIGIVVNMLSDKGQMQISAEQVKQIKKDFAKN
jgi:hypothetical protein